MQKKLYEEQKHTIYELQKELGLGHYTLYEYIKKPSKLKNMSMELLNGIAKLENIEPMELRKKMAEYLVKGGNNSEL